MNQNLAGLIDYHPTRTIHWNCLLQSQYKRKFNVRKRKSITSSITIDLLSCHGLVHFANSKIYI